MTPSGPDAADSGTTDGPDGTAGDTAPAGAGLSDDDFAARVAGQTSSDRQAEDVFAREADGASTSGPAADIDADDLSAP